MSKWKAFWRSFHKNVVVKKKYKAFLTMVFDSGYRNDINRLYELARVCTKNEVRPLHIDELVHGHKIIYPAYALGLFAMAHELPQIRVVYCPKLNKYVVVDGNHRLPALISYARSNNLNLGMIFCEVIS